MPVEAGAAWPTVRRWEYMTYEGLEAVVPLDSIGCLALRDVYARITLTLSEEEDLDGTGNHWMSRRTWAPVSGVTRWCPSRMTWDCVRTVPPNWIVT